MFTSLFKFIVKFSIHIFFRKINIENEHLIPSKGPMIVACNHPSTIMDAAIVGCLLQQKPRFLTKATVFKNPISRWLLSNMRAIPVNRAADSPDGKADTKFLFSKCFDRLVDGDTILIFPEGVSKHGRQLHKIKTGAARIALGAEAEHNFNLGVKIVTIGLNYSNSRRFRSAMYITVERPIDVSEWQNQYLENDRATVRALTDTISEQLHRQIIVTQDADEDNLLQQIEEVYQNKLIDQFDTDESIETKQFKASKGLEEALRYFKETDADRVAALHSKLDSYFYNLEQLKLKDDQFEDIGAKRSAFRAVLFHFLRIIIGLPGWLYGCINNYIPYRIPGLIADWLVKDVEYRAAALMFCGMLTFPIFYSIQAYLFYQYIHSGSITLFYLLSLPLTGFFSLIYWRWIIYTKEQWSLMATFFSKKKLFAKIITQRMAIVSLLEAAQNEYTALMAKEAV